MTRRRVPADADDYGMEPGETVEQAIRTCRTILARSATGKPIRVYSVTGKPLAFVSRDPAEDSHPEVQL